MSNATLFTGGPAYLVWNSLTWLMRADWKITNPDQFFDIPSATAVGEDKGIADKMGKLTGTPKILVSQLAAQLAALFPYNTNDNANGSNVRPASDLPAVVHMRNGGSSNLGLTATLYAALLTKMPKVTFATRKPLVSDIELTYLQALGTNVGDAASLIGTANATYAEPGLTLGDELFDRYILSLGSSAAVGAATTSTSTTVTITGGTTAGLVAGQAISGTGIPSETTIATIASSTTLTLSAAATETGTPTLTLVPVPIVTDADGITFTPDAKLEGVMPAMEPTRDFRQDKVTAALEFTPWNMDIDAFYAAYFPEVGQVLGGSTAALGLPVTITGANAAGLTLTCPLATRFKSGHDFSRVKPRTDKVQLELRDYWDGTDWHDLFTFAVNG